MSAYWILEKCQLPLFEGAVDEVAAGIGSGIVNPLRDEIGVLQVEMNALKAQIWLCEW